MEREKERLKQPKWKEINYSSDNVEGGDHGNSLFDENPNKKKDYFQIEIVDSETLFVCNICHEGLINEQEII